MTGSKPLRFLLVLCGSWAALRIAFVGSAWWTSPAGATGGGARPPPHAVRTAADPGDAPKRRTRGFAPAAGLGSVAAKRAERLVAVARTVPPAAVRPEPVRTAGIEEVQAAVPAAPFLRAALPRAGGSRFSAYGWAFLRGGGGPGLAPEGTLGGAQAGMRALYRLNRDPARPLAVSARLSSPLAAAAGAEAALGIDWRPSRHAPLHLLAERRQKLGREGRSAFGLTVYGGVSDSPLGPLRIDGYVQAGIVGARARDLFADGSLRVSLPLGRARLGAGAWAAAQPGVERLDLGPQASLRLPLAGRNVTIAADWRLRVAGRARPGSGPAVTVATDF